MHAFLKNPRHRTLLGLTLGVLFVPVMLGITACFELKTPIGDPDQGWADPRISGAWLSGDPLPEEHQAMLWLFEPWDQKTWLVTLLQFDEIGGSESTTADPEAETGQPGSSGAGEAAATTATDTSESPGEIDEDVERDAAQLTLPPEEVARLLASLTNEDRVAFDSGGVFKGWLTSIGPYRYLVLEPRLQASSERGFGTDVWWVFRIVLKGPLIQLDIFDSEREGLARVTTRGEAEAIIARHGSDPEFFEPFLLLQRVPPEAMDDVENLVDKADLKVE